MACRHFSVIRACGGEWRQHQRDHIVASPKGVGPTSLPPLSLPSTRPSAIEDRDAVRFIAEVFQGDALNAIADGPGGPVPVHEDFCWRDRPKGRHILDFRGFCPTPNEKHRGNDQRPHQTPRAPSRRSCAANETCLHASKVHRSGPLQIKFDALCQWQVSAVVDGVGLAAHVNFPSVGTGFSPPSCFFFTPKRSANLRP